jgi:Ca-activated chloride channel family protein
MPAVDPWRFTVLGYQVGLAQPLFLALCAVALLLGALALVAALRRRSRVSSFLPERLVSRLAPGVSQWRPAVQSGL